MEMEAKNPVEVVEQDIETSEPTETSFTLDAPSAEETEASTPEADFEVSEPVEDTFTENEAEPTVVDSFAREDEDQDEEEEPEEGNEDAEDTSDDDDDEEQRRRYSLLEQDYKDLQTQYAELESKYTELKAFKDQVENERKDALINNDFYMLSAEDKKDVIEHKAEYTLEEIKSKLAVICYEKKVNFNLENNQKIDNNTEEVVTFSYNDDDSSLPDWVKAVKNNMDDMD